MTTSEPKVDDQGLPGHWMDEHLPNGARCEADASSPDDWTPKCGDLAVGYITDDTGRERLVCFHHKRLFYHPTN